jgi:hypothetical protein
MTQEEKDAIIAGMVRERRSLRSTEICLREKLSNAGEMLSLAGRTAERAASSPRDIGMENTESMQYPTADELLAMVADITAARKRINEIEQLLNEC